MATSDEVLSWNIYTIFFFKVSETICGQFSCIFSLSSFSCSSCAIFELQASSLHFACFSLVIKFQSSDHNLVNDISDSVDTCKHDSIAWRGCSLTRYKIEDNIWIWKVNFVNTDYISGSIQKLVMTCLHPSASELAQSSFDRQNVIKVHNTSWFVSNANCTLWCLAISVNTGLVAYSRLRQVTASVWMNKKHVIYFHHQKELQYQHPWYCHSVWCYDLWTIGKLTACTRVRYWASITVRVRQSSNSSVKFKPMF